MSLQEKLTAFKTQFQSGKPPFEGVPAETHVLMKRAIDELVASGAANNVRRSGHAPAFTLSDADGNPVRLSDLLTRGPAVLSFYRGVWCPYCNLDLQELQLYADAITAAGATLVAITPQTAPNSRKSIAEHTLTFPILSDPGNTVADQYGLRYRLPSYLIDVHKQFGIDLPAINGDESWTLPMPARFIVDPQGQIRYAESNPDYTRRPEPADVVQALERLRHPSVV
ncbi:MAG: peroxiredoxin-like family protein [bacterium]